MFYHYLDDFINTLLFGKSLHRIMFVHATTITKKIPGRISVGSGYSDIWSMRTLDKTKNI